MVTGPRRSNFEPPILNPSLNNFVDKESTKNLNDFDDLIFEDSPGVHSGYSYDYYSEKESSTRFLNDQDTRDRLHEKQNFEDLFHEDDPITEGKLRRNKIKQSLRAGTTGSRVIYYLLTLTAFGLMVWLGELTEPIGRTILTLLISLAVFVVLSTICSSVVFTIEWITTRYGLTNVYTNIKIRDLWCDLGKIMGSTCNLILVLFLIHGDARLTILGPAVVLEIYDVFVLLSMYFIRKITKRNFARSGAITHDTVADYRAIIACTLAVEIAQNRAEDIRKARYLAEKCVTLKDMNRALNYAMSIFEKSRMDCEKIISNVTVNLPESYNWYPEICHGFPKRNRVKIPSYLQEPIYSRFIDDGPSEAYSFALIMHSLPITIWTRFKEWHITETAQAMAMAKALFEDLIVLQKDLKSILAFQKEMLDKADKATPLYSYDLFFTAENSQRHLFELYTKHLEYYEGRVHGRRYTYKEAREFVELSRQCLNVLESHDEKEGRKLSIYFFKIIVGADISKILFDVSDSQNTFSMNDMLALVDELYTGKAMVARQLKGHIEMRKLMRSMFLFLMIFPLSLVVIVFNFNLIQIIVILVSLWAAYRLNFSDFHKMFTYSFELLVLNSVYKIGDRLEWGNKLCIVEEIHFLYTKTADIQEKILIIPHTQLLSSSRLSNTSMSNRSIFVIKLRLSPITTSYTLEVLREFVRLYIQNRPSKYMTKGFYTKIEKYQPGHYLELDLYCWCTDQWHQWMRVGSLETKMRCFVNSVTKFLKVEYHEPVQPCVLSPSP